MVSELFRLFASEKRRSNDPMQAVRPAAYWTALVRLIERDPSLIKRARIHVEQLLESGQSSPSDSLQEWKNTLGGESLADLSRILTAEGEHSDRLRWSSPFEAILSGNEQEHLATSS